MNQKYSSIKRLSICALALPLLLLTPTTAFANSQPTSANNPIAQTETDPYHFNEETGMWENSQYTWDPATRKTSPKDTTDYSYNTNTGMWDTPEWAYSSQSDKYMPNAPAPPNTAPSISAPASTIAQDISNTEQNRAAKNTINDPPANGANNTFSNFYNADISNRLTSSAYSGDSTVLGNTNGGNATSGNATTISTVLNLLQSNTSVGNLDNVAMFTTNVDGNVVGDLYIDPGILASLQPAGQNNLGSDIIVNHAANNAINNNIELTASSGNATVSGNTSAGDAATGNANAVLNLVNFLNSSILSGDSFVGILNVNGNLDGDILLPPGSLAALIASNGTSGTDLEVDTTRPDSNILVADTQNIQNDMNLSATSGNTSVHNNTNAGNATSGSARTNVTVLNLTGHEIVSSNSLLVFINVLGQWIGAILDAPTGSTAAAFGGTPSSTSTARGNVSGSVISNNSIQNNVTIGAQTGDASVNNNTNGGSAQSGNATASANIANISNTSMALSEWFGILFINVFGIWNGSFGLDTQAGGLATPAPAAKPDKITGTGATTKPINQAVAKQVFRFVSSASTVLEPRYEQTHEIKGTAMPDTDEQDKEDKGPRVLGITNSNDGGGATSFLSPTQRDINVAVSAVIAGAILVGIERVLAHRDSRRLGQQ